MREFKVILLADDDREDRQLLEEIISDIDPLTEIFSVINGKQAIEFLYACRDKELPNIVILDYNMPQLTGAEVLIKMAEDERLCKVPTVILSTSDSKEHIKNCIANGAKEYFVKPSNIHQLTDIAQKILGMAN
jgi:CheY-like chemotaxis protein